MIEDFENGNIQGQIDEELSKFNWGAFFLTFIWAVPNGAWKDFWPTFLIMILFSLLAQIPLLGLIFVILNICLAIYVGKKGNEWAWYGSKKWETLETFISVQKTWGALSPVVFVALCIVVPMAISIITFILVMPQAGAIMSQAETINKTAVSQIVKAPEYKDFNNGVDISNYLISKNLYKKFFLVDNPTGVLADKKGPYTAVLTFEKKGDCTLTKKNCFVLYSVKTPDKIDPVMKTYFDDNGSTLSANKLN